MIDQAFQDQVDRCLAALEKKQPALHRLRRVPIDLIAEAVAQELVGVLHSVRIVAWRDAPVKRAVLAIALRNGSIVGKPVYVEHDTSLVKA